MGVKTNFILELSPKILRPLKKISQLCYKNRTHSSQLQHIRQKFFYCIPPLSDLHSIFFSFGILQAICWICRFLKQAKITEKFFVFQKGKILNLYIFFVHNSILNGFWSILYLSLSLLLQVQGVQQHGTEFHTGIIVANISTLGEELNCRNVCYRSQSLPKVYGKFSVSCAFSFLSRLQNQLCLYWIFLLYEKHLNFHRSSISK